jgi:metal-dependent hydrolase (beta-lactamase superfamily II)
VTGGVAETPEEVRKIARRFQEFECQKVISGHCTGKKASAILERELKGDYLGLSTGMEFDV